MDFGPRSLQPDRPTYAPASHTMAFTPNVLWQWLTIFSSEYYQNTNCYSFTYPSEMEDWVGLSTMSVNNLLKVITRKRSWWDSNPRPLSHWSETLPLRHRGTRPLQTRDDVTDVPYRPMCKMSATITISWLAKICLTYIMPLLVSTKNPMIYSTSISMDNLTSHWQNFSHSVLLIGFTAC